MKELIEHIWQVMLWEFKNNKNFTETAHKIPSVYGQDVITDCWVQNWFSKFCSDDTSLRDEPITNGFHCLVGKVAGKRCENLSLSFNIFSRSKFV